MKKSIKVVEVEGEGLVSFIDCTITVFCANYIYTGTLEGVNDTCIKLRDASIVYETGELTAKRFKDAQAFGGDWYIQIASIESFGPGK